MTDRSHFDEALHRVEASDYQWQVHGSKGSLREAMVAQTHAALAVADELRRANDSRDQFYTEVLDLLVRITEDPFGAPKDDGSPRSGQPAAATCCGVCGKGTPGVEGQCTGGPLTRVQWRAHSEDFAKRLERVGANRLDAALWGEKTAVNHFGPCPEES